MNRARSVMLAAVWAAAAVAVAGAEEKTATLDMGRAIKAHPDTKTAETILQGQLDEFEAEQREMVAEAKRLKEAFDKARGEAVNEALSEETREAKAELAKERLRAMREYEKKLRDTGRSRQRQLSDQELRLRRRIVAKIRGVVREYAEKHGISLVVDSSNGANAIETVVYGSEKIDITEAILESIEKAGAK